jgi:hypothetical protein
MCYRGVLDMLCTRALGADHFVIISVSCLISSVMQGDSPQKYDRIKSIQDFHNQFFMAYAASGLYLGYIRVVSGLYGAA